ncbi:amino acid adenylation domain-containing protein [Xylariaceae sp. FL0016]|nr:amino acid adenylation domain-containing protein [Xylariaceae sp. FL0016]
MEVGTTVDTNGLSILNANPSRLPGPRFLHELVSSAGEDGAPAIDYLSDQGDQVAISYRELHLASDMLASQIQDALDHTPCIGNREAFIIPVLIPQSPQLYIALLAALKAGCAFCPLNLDAPGERVKFILHDIDARVALVSDRYASKIPSGGGNPCAIIRVDDILNVSNSQSPAVRPCPNQVPEDTAYVMYTSGSTGTPKGVAISHGSATQAMLAHDLHIPPFSRFLQFAAPTFDVSVFEIFFPLWRGRTLVACDRSELLTDLPGILRKLEIDACELTPSVAGSLLKRRANAPSLQLILTIGEMLSRPVIEEFGGNGEKTSVLWGMYGPTEATIHCTLQPAFPTKSSTYNIGVPLDTVSAFVIEIQASDSSLTEFRVLPVGEIGELAVGGSQLATNYINRPEQTAASFITSRWGRVYRTGDKARILPDGTIECLGRIGDGQVKLNGQRLELGEVEHALLRTPGCHGAFATVVSNSLIAFAAVDDENNARKQILSQCKSWLPAFMVPTDIVTTQSFPRLPSGKIDRKKLIQDYEATILSHVGIESEAKDGLERILCDLAAQLLGGPIGPLTPLSAVKFDSLIAIQYASSLRTEGFAIAPADILTAVTLRDIWKTLQQRGPETSAAGTHPSEQPAHKSIPKSVLDQGFHDVEWVGKCTPLQKSMIAETLKDPRLYINEVALQLPSHVNVMSIKYWFSDLAQRNEILRAGFAFVDDELHQVIWTQLLDEQVRISGEDDSRKPFDCESFLRRPLRVVIHPGKTPAAHHSAILTLHHALYDGWTIDLLIEDLSRLSIGLSPIQRPQFRVASHHILANYNQESDDAKEFWADHLLACDPGFMPNFRTTYVSKPQISTISKAIKLNPQKIEDFALKTRIGPQVIFQACLVWLWGALNGVEDVVIGSVSSGRTLPIAGIEKIMGPLVKTLPLRVDLNRYRSIKTLLQNIHAVNRSVLRHTELQLTDIKRAASLATTTNLFDIIFAYQETLPSRKQERDDVRELWHKDCVEAKVLVEIQPLNDSYVCQMTWHTEAFSQDQAELFIDHLDHLTEHVVENEEASMRSIMGGFPPTLLSQYNTRPNRLKTFASLSKLFENTAALYPTHDAMNFATAISDSELCAMPYSSLNAKANQIARLLVSRGAVQGGIIAIVMEKSQMMYCTILGILKTGCAYLPILPSTPVNRLQLIISQARPMFCFVDTPSSFPELDVTTCMILNIDETELSSYPTDNIDLDHDLDNLAYIIYTSGTTGVPKGVSVTNRNMLSNLEALSRIYPHRSQERMLQACSQAFDVSVFEIFFSWANGMCLCAATNDILFEDLEGFIRTLRVTHLSMTVTVASLVDPGAVPEVRFLVTSGEPMTDEVLDKWCDHLYQGYGPSETTNICTARKVSKGDSSRYLGRSFENTSSFVLDPNSTELVPIGCIGELCFGGDQVASGYLCMPDATSTKFIEHPQHGRLYRSGDLGRMLPDGSLIILGRKDTQIKLRGLRIELHEIQAVALKSGVARSSISVVISRRNIDARQLALFFVPVCQDIQSFSHVALTNPVREAISVLRSALQQALPGYMVPSFIFPISALPLTSSGKVNQERLLHSVDDISEDTLRCCSSAQGLQGDEEEGTETEYLIANLIAEVLKIDRETISRWSSFASLGLDSISAMPLARKLQATLQKRIPLSLVLQNPSVARLATALYSVEANSVRGESEDLPLLPLQLVESTSERLVSLGRLVANVFPCTPLQEAMLNSSLTTHDKNVYCNQTVFELHVSSASMIQYWTDLFSRHEILRTCFSVTDDLRHPFVQVVLQSYVPQWKFLEAEDKSLSSMKKMHKSSLSSVLDSSEPPISLAIIRTKSGAEILSFVCHHALYDGLSMRILTSEIEAMHNGLHLAPAPSIAPFLREATTSPPEQDIFWAKHLDGFTPSRLQQAAFDDASSEIVSVYRTLDCSLRDAETQLKHSGVSLLSLCHAAWAVTLSLLQRRQDICFGNVTSGRSINIDLIDSLVAPCFNTVPLRIELARSRSLVDVMRKFQSINAEMVPYQFVSLRKIQSRLKHARLFDTVFILQPGSESLDGTLWSIQEENGTMDVPIICEVMPSKTADKLDVCLHRNLSLFSKGAIEVILEVFLHTMKTSLNNPDSNIPVMSSLPTQWQEDICHLFILDEQGALRIQGSAVPVGDSWSTMEKTIRTVLSRLSGMPEQSIERQVSIHRYGLDSIAATQLAALLRRNQISVSAIDVMENPTCAGIAICALKKQHNPKTSYNFDAFRDKVSNDLEGINELPSTLEAVLPCTSTQQGMISQFIASNGGQYFNHMSWAISREIDASCVISAWHRLVRRHQILRVGFVPVDHEDTAFSMVVWQAADLRYPVSFHESVTFDLGEWRSNSTEEAFQVLAKPPWNVAVVGKNGDMSSPDKLVMHLSIHHALYDAHSLHCLMQDLMDLVNGATEKFRTPLQTALAQCLDTTRASQAHGEEFWKARSESVLLTKFPSMTPCHVDTPTFLTAVRACGASPLQLRKAAAQAGVTVHVACQAAWARILSAYVGESSVMFGVVFSGRLDDAAEHAVFPMITTLPIIARTSPSNDALLRELMEFNSGLRRSEHLPLPQIQRWLGRPDTALFDTILVYQSTKGTTRDLPLAIVDDIASVEYPVSLEIVEMGPDLISLNLTFRTDIVPQEQAETMLSQFEIILNDLLFRPNGMTTNLSVNHPEAYSNFPAKCPELPSKAKLLHQLVEQTAQDHPESIALEFVHDISDAVHRKQWTYKSLDDMGNRVANLICAHRIPPGSIVATCFNKCPEAYFTILGILKAGCAFLCLDPSAPLARREFILADSSSALLLVEKVHREEKYGSISIPMQIVQEDGLVHVDPNPPALSRQISLSDTSYCLYTSGTTGTPKGCLISHDNTVQAMAAFEHLFSGHWNANSRWLQFASFHFDVSVLEQYWSWSVGIAVVAAPKDLILSDLAVTISRLEITHIDLTPSLARLIRPEDVPSLCDGVFITGGEQLRQEILEAWGPKRVIYNAYGPTEATIGVTMSSRVPSNGKPSNIGHPFPNVGVYVVEPGSEVPVLKGGVGELCVAGRLVGKGYLNRADLTKERFPTFKTTDHRVYRTGDLVRVLQDESVEFLGRADDQVKLRGQRLEIGEINYVIKFGLKDEAVDVATAVIRHPKHDREMLVSFVASSQHVLPEGGPDIYQDEHHLHLTKKAREFCGSRLPGYMVPSFILCVSFIPLSPNNKADTSRLKALFMALTPEHLQLLTHAASVLRRPLSDKERVVAKALSSIVLVEEKFIVPTSTIFELGVDSITANRLARQLRDLGFESATPSLVLKHPQISQLTKALLRRTTSASSNHVQQCKQYVRATFHRHIGMASRVLHVEKEDVEYIAPCSPLQEGIIVRSRANEVQSSYFNQFQFELDPRTSVDRLKRSLNRLLSSFAILRTAFVGTVDGYIQVALKEQSLRWHDISVPEPSIDQTISNRRVAWVVANRSVLRYPLEVDHIKYDGKQLLLLRIFHAIYDAHSFNIMLRHIEAQYYDLPGPRAPDFIDVLPHGPLLSHSHSRSFWQARFEGHKFQPMPLLSSEPGGSPRTASRNLHIRGLDARRKSLGVTHQTVLQACWLATIRRYFTDTPTIGVIFSGRSLMIDDIDNVVGPLFNTLPCKIQTPSDKPAEFIRQVHEYNTTVLEYVHTPLRDIQKWCSNGQPLFDTLFAFDRDDIPEAPAQSPSPWIAISSFAEPDYPLTVEIVLTGDASFKVTVVTKAGIADASAIELIMDDFTHALENIASPGSSKFISSTPIGFHAESPTPCPSELSEGILSSTLNSPATSASTFAWTETALEIQHEIALVAGVSDEIISENTNVFDLGLDSIDMVKLASKLTRKGLRLSMSTLLRNPTVESIAAALELSETPGPQSSSLEKLEEKKTVLMGYLRDTGANMQDVEAIYPPTPLQESMFAEMVLSDYRRYFNHDVLEIQPDTDISRLKAAWATVYAESPILRTVFAEIDDAKIDSAYCQIVMRDQFEFRPDVEVQDLDEVANILEEARNLAVESGGASNLFQLRVAKTRSKNYLVLSLAHALYDGWSLDMLHSDVHTAYEGRYIKRLDYDLHISRLLTAYSSMPAENTFWADFLHDSQPTLIALAEPGSVDLSEASHRLETVSSLSLASIRSLCRRFRVTPQVLCHGCWAVVLSMLSKSLDVTFGVVLSGRDTDEAQRLLFPTMNTVPLRVVLHGTVAAYLEYLQGILSNVIEHQQVPLREVLRRADGIGAQLFNTLSLLQNTREPPSKTESLVKSIQSSSAIDYPICVEMELTENAVLWRLACDRHYASLDGANEILSKLETTMRFFYANGDNDILQFDANSAVVLICGQQTVELGDDYRGRHEESAPQYAPQSVDTRTATLKTPMLDVLSELSGIKWDAIDLNQTIYHLGLDSISAIKASSMLRKRGLNASVRSLLQASSVRDLLHLSEELPYASSIQSSPATSEHLTLNLNSHFIASLVKNIDMAMSSIERVLPALPMQIHMLSSWQNTKGKAFFPMFTYRLNGRIRPETISDAWGYIIEQVPILRTFFAAHDSDTLPMVQIVMTADHARSRLTESSNTSTVQGQWDVVYQVTPFALLRVRTSELGEAFVDLRIHHALYDGISLPIIVKCLTRVLDHSPKALPLSYSDLWFKFALSHGDEQARERSKQFWSSYLTSGDTILSLYHAQAVKFETPKHIANLEKNAIDDVTQLRTVCSQTGISLQALFFAAFSKVYAALTAQSQFSGSEKNFDVVIGVYLSNRAAFVEAEEVPLPTLIILPLRVRSPLKRHVRALATEIQKDLVDIGNTENYAASLWDIYRWANVRVDTFVNFLSLPQENPSDKDSDSIVHEVGEHPVAEVNDFNPELLASPRSSLLTANRAAEAYVQNALDVEVAIREQQMDVGLFCSDMRLDPTRANAIVGDTVSILDNL